MWCKSTRTLILIGIVALAPSLAWAQQSKVVVVPIAAAPDARFKSLEDPATTDQINRYLDVSGQLKFIQQNWVDALDKNRSLGAPYWPESFWLDIKTEMQQTDLKPMMIMLYQHHVSRQSMQEALDAGCAQLSKSCSGPPVGVKWANLQRSMEPDFETLRLAKTQAVLMAVYAKDKPKIKEARAKYLAAHPDYKD